MKVTSEGLPPLAGWKAHLLTALTVVSGLVGAALLLGTLDRESHSTRSGQAGSEQERNR